MRVPEEKSEALARWYLDVLGSGPAASIADDVFACQLGETTVRFAAAGPGDDPFYHFALLVPGDRFSAAHGWLAERVELLDDPSTGSNVFRFDNWDALACYLVDPGGNIVEFIAHRRIGERGTGGSFDPGELIGLSELGLVIDDKARAAAMLEEAGLCVFDGERDDPRSLLFMGERGRVLILSPVGRGWLPTGRPAEAHPLDAQLWGTRDAEVELPGGQRVATSARS